MNRTNAATRKDSPTDEIATPVVVKTVPFSKAHIVPKMARGAPISNNHLEESILDSNEMTILLLERGFILGKSKKTRDRFMLICHIHKK